MKDIKEFDDVQLQLMVALPRQAKTNAHVTKVHSESEPFSVSWNYWYCSRVQLPNLNPFG